MAIRKIAKMGHPVLARRADVVADPAAHEIQRLLQDMEETVLDANGAGLAAPQVYASVRIVIFEAPARRTPEGAMPPDPRSTAPKTVLINPEIDILSETQELGWEGCLSVPGMRGEVPRFTHLKYRGLGPDGTVIEREATGFHARVVQHECDHLDGILYPQRMIDLSRLIFESEWSHFLTAEAEAGTSA